VLWWIVVLRCVMSVMCVALCDCGDTVQVHAVPNKQTGFSWSLFVSFCASCVMRCATRSVFAFPSALHLTVCRAVSNLFPVSPLALNVLSS
jgi:hypothetical protein